MLPSSMLLVKSEVPPNVVVVHCHDLGRFIGAYGVSTVRTPRLDALAREGVLFERAFATAPQCSPARSSLFTGRYPQSTGVLGLTHEPFGWDMVDPGSHLANRLRGLGYATELLGVHHESRVLSDDEVARRLGFDSVATGGLAPEVGERARMAIARLASADQPFYLQVGFVEPHRLQSRRDEPGVVGFLGDHIDPDATLGVTIPEYIEPTAASADEIAELQGAVAMLDEGIGVVLDAVDQAGIAEHTLVVFTTDHGLALPRAKCSLYEAGLEVALIIRVPWRAAWRERRVADLVSHVDVVPTIIELIEAAPDSPDDRSLSSIVERGLPGEGHIFGQLTFHTYYDPKRSVRDERFKLIVNFSNGQTAMDPTQSWMRRSIPIGLDRGNMLNSATVEFYDLDADPLEQHNLVDDPGYRLRIEAMTCRLREWLTSVDDPILRGPVPAPRHAAALAAVASPSRL